MSLGLMVDALCFAEGTLIRGSQDEDIGRILNNINKTVTAYGNAGLHRICHKPKINSAKSVPAKEPDLLKNVLACPLVAPGLWGGCAWR